MPCYHPLTAFRTSDGSIVFHESKHVVSDLQLPCGQCIGCRLRRSAVWATRCMHELQLHEKSCYVTLTFDDNHIPPNLSLDYRDFQLFMKRLRKHFRSQKIRFYMCGEYGEKFGRPHFHAILFGVDFPDKEILRKSPSGFILHRSKILEDLWPFGFSSIGDVTFESCAYVARYIMKKVTGNKSIEHYSDIVDETGEIISRTPEFNKMSLKPGIGAKWFEKYQSDVYPHDFVVVGTRKLMPPRYYDNLYKKDNPFEFDEILYNRYKSAMLHVDDTTPERLAVKEVVQQAKLNKLKRVLP